MRTNFLAVKKQYNKDVADIIIKTEVTNYLKKLEKYGHSGSQCTEITCYDLFMLARYSTVETFKLSDCINDLRQPQKVIIFDIIASGDDPDNQIKEFLTDNLNHYQGKDDLINRLKGLDLDNAIRNFLND